MLFLSVKLCELCGTQLVHTLGVGVGGHVGGLCGTQLVHRLRSRGRWASSRSFDCPAPNCCLFLPVSPFLLGRALWAASRFTVAMSPELIQQFLQATVSGLHETQPPSVRISAVRAIWG